MLWGRRDKLHYLRIEMKPKTRYGGLAAGCWAGTKGGAVSAAPGEDQKKWVRSDGSGVETREEGRDSVHLGRELSLHFEKLVQLF